jgi:hypothetical protein
MHIWDQYWDLRIAECPCDIHLIAYLEERGLKDKTIYHFGSGGHHILGLRCAENGSNNAVISITASPQEYDSFIKLLVAKPAIAKLYTCHFGDIYCINERHLPELDVVTLFHLCEFRSEKNDAYGALTDEAVALALFRRLKPGGLALFYTGSYAWNSAEPIVAKLAADGFIDLVETYKGLPVYRRTDKPA